MCRTQLFKGQGADTNPFERFDLAGAARISRSVVRLPQVGCQEFCCAFCSLLALNRPLLVLALGAIAIGRTFDPHAAHISGKMSVVTHSQGETGLTDLRR